MLESGVYVITGGTRAIGAGVAASWLGYRGRVCVGIPKQPRTRCTCSCGRHVQVYLRQSEDE